MLLILLSSPNRITFAVGESDRLDEEDYTISAEVRKQSFGCLYKIQRNNQKTEQQLLLQKHYIQALTSGFGCVGGSEEECSSVIIVALNNIRDLCQRFRGLDGGRYQQAITIVSKQVRTIAGKDRTR
ncbi:MAG: hypothetical protein EZS28_031604 [Streblomastix strix]|uniref:Uncharacterized protein n=1 Tax=Streblomastix strix TaxID=222440 RepID=A0A5J4UR70_9EUKA|nr:MAG: hypothetical protein EZS28_031604 [Streblomastix strix]